MKTLSGINDFAKRLLTVHFLEFEGETYGRIMKGFKLTVYVDGHNKILFTQDIREESKNISDICCDLISECRGAMMKAGYEK